MEDRSKLKNKINTLLKVDDKLVAKRCTQKYLDKIGIYSDLIEYTKILGDVKIIERIQYILQEIEGIPSCETCGKKVKLVDSRFQRFCSLKCMANNPEVRNKTAKTNVERYGVEIPQKKIIDKDLLYDLYVIQRKSILEISKILGNISNVSVQARLKEYDIPQRSRSETQLLAMEPYKGSLRPTIHIDRDELIRKYQLEFVPMRALAEEYGCHVETIRRFLQQEGVECFHRRSYIEHIMIEMLKKNNINYETNKRTLLENQLEIDIFLPDFSIGIEIHGMTTHSYMKGNKNSDYHFNKYSIARKKGIKLYQFWEPDVVEKLPIIESMILNSCNLSSIKIGSRKCIAKEVEYSLFNKFCEDNHIQGSPAKNNRAIGLYYNDILVSVITYQIKENQTIITRFCSLIGHNIQGGFSKLLKYIPGRKIITYSSNDISDGDLYSINGFDLINEQKSDMWYTDYNFIYNRQKFMKSKLKNFDFYDDAKSEIEIMLDNGYDVIYKSGTKTWLLDRSASQKERAN